MSVENRKARFDYFVVRVENAGMVLIGSEVKQIRDGKASLVDSYCYFVGNELFVKNFLITETKSKFSHDPKRDKKLLLTKTELKKLKREVEKDKGMTIVPLKVYSNKNYLLKMEIGLCKGKKDYDKRAVIKNRELDREIRNFV